MKNHHTIIIVLLLLTGHCSIAQISMGGLPQSYQLKSDNAEIVILSILPPDLDQIEMEDALAEEQFSPRRFSILLPVNANLYNLGTWLSMPDGSNIWRLKLISENALAISLYFDDFHLSKNAQLFLYDENGNQIKGAFTSFNNHKSRLFATELIYGDAVILELNGIKSDDSSALNISDLAYAYRDISLPGQMKGFGGSDFCEVNVGCSPEGLNWQEVKNGVVRIQIKVSGSGYWCTGSVINNARNDNMPYVLTADHCAFQLGHYATPSDLNQWLFYFKYESQGCEDPGSEPTIKSMLGATKVAQGGNRGSTGSDFYLILLNQNIPNNYQPYFMGWSADDEVSPSGVTIHHPEGDIKKISTYTVPVVTVSWLGSGLPSHWKVFWTETANGWGVTEGGSSGSPLFNEQGKIIGTLTGGYAACEASGSIGPDAPDFYGKFSYHWILNGNSDTARLKPWLDPDNTGITQLNGKILGINNEEFERTNSIHLFPNPSADILNINFTNFEPLVLNMVIFDFLGKQVKNLAIEATVGFVTIDIRNIPDGVYLLNVNFEIGSITKRFVKQN